MKHVNLFSILLLPVLFSGDSKLTAPREPQAAPHFVTGKPHPRQVKQTRRVLPRMVPVTRAHDVSPVGHAEVEGHRRRRG